MEGSGRVEAFSRLPAGAERRCSGLAFPCHALRAGRGSWLERRWGRGAECCRMCRVQGLLLRRLFSRS